MKTDCALVLDDGTEFPGVSFGAPAPLPHEVPSLMGSAAPRSIGEVVFCTAMIGYHELLTDPSYTGQIVVLTYPHAGNYGCHDAWSEAGEAGAHRREVSPAALVIRSLYTGPVPEGRLSLSQYMLNHGLPGIHGVDTRRLTLHLRDHGVRTGLVLRTGAEDVPDMTAAPGNGRLPAHPGPVTELLRQFPPMLGRSLIGEVGTREAYEVNPDGHPHLALLDCGAKGGIVRQLQSAGCRITVFPSDATFDGIQRAGVDALFVSNGPGDPAALAGQVSLIREAVGNMPVLGICLGHQLIAEALGARTFKMAFGHHGINHPVRDRESGRVFVTSQNHGFAVDPDALPAGCRIWFENANDGTVEGLAADELNIRTTQFHPEAAPGPLDSHWIFSRFLETAVGGAHAGAR